MAQDLSFLDYRRAVAVRYNLRNGEYVVPLSDLDDTAFYRFSFYNRNSAELEYRLLNMLVKIDALQYDAALKCRAEYYREMGAHFLLRDAEIADNAAEAQRYRDVIATFQDVRAREREPGLVFSEESMVGTVSEWKKAVDKLHKDLSDFVSARLHLSKIITLLSYLNLYRLVTLFARLGVKSFWMLASEQHWIDAQDNLGGIHIQRSDIDLPAGTLNFLSVAVFASRLAAHGSAIVKHAFSEREGEKEIPVIDRILREFSARMMNIMNDIAWVFINLLTNYAAVWGIAEPLANTLTLMALVWDSSWLMIHWYREERDWEKKKVEKKAELTQYREEEENAILIMWELKVLDALILETRFKYGFMILAALAITTSYILFLAAISAAVSTLCLSICVVGFAMYGSADEFAAWMRAYFGTLEIEGEREEMRAKFFTVFTQTLLPPVVMMGLLSLGWQIAALGAVAAVAYSYMPKKWDCFAPDDDAAIDNHTAQFRY